MKIDITKYLTPAQRVLALIDVPGSYKTGGLPERVSIGRYENGREHGYCVLVEEAGASPGICVSFAQYRSSDQVVVYHGAPADFDADGCPNVQHIWEERALFRPDDEEGAARHVSKLVAQALRARPEGK